MSTEAHTATAPRRRRKTIAAQPPLPLQPARRAWQPSIFRRKDRGSRLYCRLKDESGRIIIRSTGRHTEAGAREMLHLMVHLIEAGGAL